MNSHIQTLLFLFSECAYLNNYYELSYEAHKVILIMQTKKQGFVYLTRPDT